MGIESVPKFIREHYEVHECDFPHFRDSLKVESFPGVPGGSGVQDSEHPKRCSQPFPQIPYGAFCSPRLNEDVFHCNAPAIPR